jgi:hypothetical protein
MGGCGAKAGGARRTAGLCSRLVSRAGSDDIEARGQQGDERAEFSKSSAGTGVPGFGRRPARLRRRRRERGGTDDFRAGIDRDLDLVIGRSLGFDLGDIRPIDGRARVDGGMGGAVEDAT